MTEYIERGATCKDCLHYCVCKDTWADENWGDNALREMFSPKGCDNYRPAADVVEAVRCKDCKHRYVPTRCALWYASVDDKEYFVERGDDFYCSHGEAKMDGKGEGE